MQRAPDLALIEAIVDEARRASDRGAVASYIPMLAAVDPTQFGIAIELADGRSFVGGDAHVGFSIQSISKVFALTLALGKVGERLWERVGREPSGSAFNSIVQLEVEHGIPRNPFINAGAIMTADVNLGGRPPAEIIGEMLRLVRWAATDQSIAVDAEVARCENETGERNRALAHFMKAEGALRHDPDQVLDAYFNGCAIEMSCLQLARAGRYLMLDGRHPDGGRIVPDHRARRILSLMLTCGHYDASGDFAYRVGIPGKSGVGGGILAVVPGIASVAVWSPGLDERGNSKLGGLALERLAAATGWSVFSR